MATFFFSRCLLAFCGVVTVPGLQLISFPPNPPKFLAIMKTLTPDEAPPTIVEVVGGAAIIVLAAVGVALAFSFLALRYVAVQILTPKK